MRFVKAMSDCGSNDADMHVGRPRTSEDKNREPRRAEGNSAGTIYYQSSRARHLDLGGTGTVERIV